jgi:hypothetical protein
MVLPAVDVKAQVSEVMDGQESVVEICAGSGSPPKWDPRGG